MKTVISLLSFLILSLLFLDVKTRDRKDVRLFKPFEESNHLTLLRNLEVTCTYDICPPTQGYCKGEKCVCLEGFITIVNEKSTTLCNYKQKNVMVSLLLESFGLIGFGHIYAGRFLAGIVKLVCFYVIICYGSQFVIVFMKENTDTDAAYWVKLLISAACLTIPVIWHLIDLYKWSNNSYLDGNGQQLLNW
jgi:TM2 domain-containing membrane protein YozV